MRLASILMVSLLVLAMPSTVFAETFNGLVYNAPPYQNDDQLEYDANLLGVLTSTVKLYDNTEMQSIVSSLEEKNLDVLIGFDMSKINFPGPNITDVKLDMIKPYIQIANTHSNVQAIILEKDPIVYMSEERIIEIAYYIESQGIPVGVAMSPDNWIKTPNLADHISIVYVYAFDYWNGSSGYDAAKNAKNLYNDYVKKYSNEVIFEFGFPTDGNAIGYITPTLDEQQTFIDQITTSEINYIFFSLTDDKNKMFKLGFENNSAEYNWGLYTEDRGDKKSRIMNINSAKPELIIAEKDNSQPNVLQIDIFATQPTGITLIDGNDRIDFYVNEYLKIFYESNSGYENVSIVSQIENAVKYSFTPTPMVFAACEPGIDCEYIVNNDDPLSYLIAVIIDGLHSVLEFKNFLSEAILVALLTSLIGGVFYVLQPIIFDLYSRKKNMIRNV